MSVFLNDLFEIPDHVRSGDFVLRLAEGLQQADRTLANYVVTPQLARCFDEALGLVRDAVVQRSSKASFLLGSFGSGKSHFMAVLNLLLQGHPGARSIPELAAVVAKHNGWMAGKKFLLVPYNLIGAAGMESGILGGYAHFIRAHRPEAPTPPLYRSDAILTDAARLRATMGDAPFFRQLNSVPAASTGWGKLATGWDAVSYEDAARAAPTDERRQRLVSNLVDRMFSAAVQAAEFVDLDEGLSVISRHANQLGYEAVVLFLDELVLWLASHAADPAFVAREGQKIVKLVESGQANRPIPLISFVAKQRDFKELVRDQVSGQQLQQIGDVFTFQNLRFHEIRLQDSNLAAIVEKRLLKPKSDTARAQLDQAFRQITARDTVRDILLTEHYDTDQFRKLYPFSPALVETLVVLSFALQRERTALKVMLQLLVEKKHILRLGEIVPVGEIFDIIAEGNDAISDVIRRDWQTAKRLYEQKLRPLIEAKHNLRTEQVASLPPDDSKAINFRADARVAKTILLAALAPECSVLKDLDARRLAALNNGSYQTPIVGRDQHVVIGKCRDWASATGLVRLEGPEDNPRISIKLTDVDTQRILDQVQNEDNDGNRRRKIREIVADKLELSSERASDLFCPYSFGWRGTSRSCQLRFGNIREMPDDAFENTGDEWRLIVDFPFDPEGRPPSDDLSRIRKFRDENELSHRTILWIPSFMSQAALRELGELVQLDYVLSGDRLEQYSGHLSPADRVSAKALLVTRQQQLRSKVEMNLLGAYGLGDAPQGSIDPALAVDSSDMIQCLDEIVELQKPSAAGFKEAVGKILDQALQRQFPAHPLFDADTNLRPAALRNVLEEIEKAVEAEGGRIQVEPAHRRDMRQIANPLRLGEMSTESIFVLGRYWVDLFDRKMHDPAEGTPPFKVSRFRDWLDQPKRMGLPRNVQNLVLLAFVAQTRMGVYLGSKAADVDVESLPDDADIKQQSLPSDAEWEQAKRHARELWNMQAVPLLTAANVDRLASLIKEKTNAIAPHIENGLAAIETLNNRTQSSQVSARLKTARSAADLIAQLASKQGSDLLIALATACLETSPTAVSVALNALKENIEDVRRLPWTIFESVRDLTDERAPEGKIVWTEFVRKCGEDEYVTPLGAAVQAATQAAAALLARKTAKPDPDGDRPPPPPPRSPAALISQGIHALNSDWGDAASHWGSDSPEFQRNRALVEILKRKYAASQVEGDHLPDALPMDYRLQILEVHHLKAPGQSGSNDLVNMLVVTPTLHALIHADPQCRIDESHGELILFGVRLPLTYRDDHNRPP